MTENKEEKKAKEDSENHLLEIDHELEKENNQLRKDLIKKWDGLSENAVSVAITRKYPEWCDGHLMSLPIDMCESLEDVRKRFGGGHYKLKFKNSDGNYVMQRTIHIGGDPKKDGMRLENPEEKLKRIRQEERFEKIEELQMLGNRKEDKGTSDIAAVLQYMQTQQAQSNQMMMQMMAQAQQAPLNPLAGLKDSFALFADMQAGMGGGGGGDGDGTNLLPILEKFVDKMGTEQKKQNEAPRLLGSEYMAVNPGMPQMPMGGQNLPPSTSVQNLPPPTSVQNLHSSAPQAPIDPIAAAFEVLGQMDTDEALMAMDKAFDKTSPESQKKLSIIMGGDDNMENQDNEEEEEDDLESGSDSAVEGEGDSDQVTGDSFDTEPNNTGQ